MKAIDALLKVALTTGRGGIIDRGVANTLGRINPLTLLNLILTRKAYHDPGKTPERREQHKRTGELLEQAHPDALSRTKLRLGGTDLIDDTIWKKEHPDEPLPWYRQLGGRALHNRRTGPLGKLLAYPQAAVGAILGNLTRGSHYNPGTDAAAIYAHDDPVTEHELGHAIDFNELTGKGKIDPAWLKRQGKGSIRDLYHLLYGLPPASLWHEGQANIKSRKSLERSLAAEGDEPELESRLHRRQQVLPAGYGSYIGRAVDPLSLLAGTAPLIGMVGGKSYGLARATRMLEQAKKPAPAESELAKAADSATTRVDSYKGYDDQGPDMGARAVMEQGQPETPRPHKTTQGDVSDDETDRFSKGADNRVTAPEIVQPVRVTPSQSVLKAKKIAPASLPTLAKTDGNRMRFGKPYRSVVKTFADKRSAMKKTAQGFTSNPTTGTPLGPKPPPALVPYSQIERRPARPLRIPSTPNQPTPGAGPQPQPPPPQGATPGTPGIPTPPPTPGTGPPPGTGSFPLPTLEQQGDPLMSQGAVPGTHPSLESPAAGPQGDSLMPKTEPPAGTPPAKSWGGAWDALKGAWGQLPTMGKGILGGGGIGLLLLLLSKLFGKRGAASYTQHEIEHASNFFEQMSQLQKAALWGEAQARPDEIEKMACSMAKRYSRTHKVGKPPAKKGQFAAGNRFQGVKQAQGPSGNPITGTPLGPKPPVQRPQGAFGGGMPGYGGTGQQPKAIPPAPPVPMPGPAPNMVRSYQLNSPSRIMQNFMKMFQRMSQQRGPAPGAPSSPGQFGAATGAQAASPPTPGAAGQSHMRDLRNFLMSEMNQGAGAPGANAQSIPYYAGERLGRFPSVSGQIMGPIPGSSTRVGPKITRLPPEPTPATQMTVPQPPMKSPEPIIGPGPPGPLPQLGPLPLPGQQKKGTWVTRNGKRVHIKHKKKRKKSAAEFGKVAAEFGKEAVIPWRGPLGSAVGGGTGAGIGALIKLLMAKAGAPGMQDIPYGAGIYEPALVGAGLGGGLGFAGDIAAAHREGRGGRNRAEMEDELQQELNAKSAANMPAFTSQDRPAKVKEIYGALKRDHPEMPAGMKARIASRQGKPGKQKQGPPYKGPLTKASWAANLAT